MTQLPPPKPATRPLTPLAGKRLPRRALLRFGAFVLLLLAAAAVVRFTPLGSYLTRDNLQVILAGLEAAWWAPLLLVGLYILLCPLGLPATPLLIAGGIVFGAAWGSLYNFIGLLLGAVTSYALAQRLGGELAQHFGGARLKRVVRNLSRHGFWYLVGARFFPVPFPVVNFAMALAGIRFLPFVISTAIGLVPSVTIWTYFYYSIFHAAAAERAGKVQEILIALFVLGFFSLLPGLVRRRMRARRYRRLVATRRGRR